MRHEIAQIQQHAVQNHTAAIIEIGTNLLSQTVEQTLKLTNVEARVSSHYNFTKHHHYICSTVQLIVLHVVQKNSRHALFPKVNQHVAKLKPPKTLHEQTKLQYCLSQGIGH